MSLPPMRSSYRVITTAHQNNGSAYRRFQRQPLVADREKLLHRAGHSVAVVILVLAAVLALQL